MTRAARLSRTFFEERVGDRRGRPMNHAPEEVPSARAYVVKEWSEIAMRRSEQAARVHFARYANTALTTATNERFAAARALRERLTGRIVAAALRDAQYLAASVGRPLRAEARAFRDALAALTAKTIELSENAATFGTGNDLRATAAALESYRNEPTSASRRRIDAIVRRPGTEDRAALVSAVRDAADVNSDPTTWATWAIAIGIEPPCESEALERERRSSWRRALLSATKKKAVVTRERSRARPI